MKILRWVLTYIWVIIASFLGILVCVLRPFNPDNTRICGILIGQLPRYFFNFDIVYENREEYLGIRSSLIVSNHQDNLDLFTIGRLVPTKTVTIGKKELLYIPFFGQLYILAGNICIDRSNRNKAFKSLTKAASFLKEKKLNIWIMPEGTRSKGRGLLPFKKGPFHMALKSSQPIVPVVVSSYEKLNLNRWKSGKVYLKALPPMYANLDHDNPVEELRERCYEVMKNAIAKLDEKASQ